MWCRVLVGLSRWLDLREGGVMRIVRVNMDLFVVLG
jgi:hypothetical protein